jgi:outer membrane protein assembly factor BamB
MNRPVVTAGSAALPLSLLALLLLTPPAAAEDWPRWRGPRGDGTWQGPAMPEAWPEGGPKRLWRQPIGGGYAGVSVVGSRVVTMDRQTAPAEVERIVCLDADTGDELWTHAYAVEYGKLDYGNGPRAAPTIHDGRAYTLGALGHVCCIDLDTGRLVWTVDTVKQHKAVIPTWGLAASPVIDGDRVIVHVGAKPEGCLLALDRRDGRVVWRGGDDPAGYCTPIFVEHAGRRQIVCWTPEHIVGHNPADGAVLWKIPYKVTYGVSIATPIFRHGLVFVAGYWEGSKAIRLGDDPREATLAWEDRRNLRGLMSQPLYDRGLVYLLDKGNGLTCFELASGKKLWDDGHRMMPRGRNPQASLVWLDADDGAARKEADAANDDPRSRRTIVLNSEGDLILARLGAEGYKETSRANIIGKTWAHPAYAGERCFARSDTEIVAVKLTP